MKRFVSFTTVLAVLIAIAHPAGAQVETAVSGKLAAEEMKGLIQKAQESGDVLVKSVGAEAQSALSRFETIMGDNIAKPIDQLDSSLRAEVTAMRALAAGLQRSVDSLPKCLGNEGQLLLAGAKAGLSTSLSSIPMVRGEPLAYLIEDAQRGVPYVVKHEEKDGNRHLIMRGANLWGTSDVCSVTAKAVSITEGRVVPLNVLAYDQEKVDLRMPTETPPGQWVVTVEAAKRGWFDSCKNPDRERDTEQVTAGLSIVRPQTVTVSLSSTAMCRAVDRYTYRRTGAVTATGCGTDSSHRAENVSFDKPGYKLVDWSFVDTSNTRGGASATLAGEVIHVRYHAQKRGNTCTHGNGRGSWVVVMEGEKELAEASGTTMQLVTSAVLRPGESRSFALGAESNACTEKANTISVEGRYSNGKMIAVPQVTVPRGKRETTSVEGLSAFLNNEARVGTLTLASSSCL